MENKKNGTRNIKCESDGWNKLNGYNHRYHHNCCRLLFTLNTLILQIVLLSIVLIFILLRPRFHILVLFCNFCKFIIFCWRHGTSYVKKINNNTTDTKNEKHVGKLSFSVFFSLLIQYENKNENENRFRSKNNILYLAFEAKSHYTGVFPWILYFSCFRFFPFCHFAIEPMVD